MLAGLDDVGLTSLSTPILPATHQAFPRPVSPGRPRETSVTAKSTGVTAGQEILRGDVDLCFTLRMDADPVRHGRHGSKSPAGPTASLVSDLLQRGTVRPLGPGVETGRDVLRSPSSSVSGRRLWCSPASGW